MVSQGPRSIASDTPSALGHLRVLDLAGPEGQYCGRLMADLGADVIKVEPPEGDPARHMAPFAGDCRDAERSLFFINYNTNKRSVVLDLTSSDGRDDLLRLVATADVLVETFAPGYLDGLGLGFKGLSGTNPALVLTSITPFGQSGPYRDFLGSELVAQAMGGLMYVQGDDNKPPCVAPCDQASQLASLHAAYGTLAALHHRGKTGLGQHVDVSMQEVVAHLLFTLSHYAYSSEIVRRTGVASTLAPNSYYRCKDGHVCFSIFFNHHWRELVEWMDIEALADPVWQDMNFRRSNADIVDQFVAEFVGQFTVAEFVEQGQEHHLAVSPMNTVDGLVNSPQMNARDYFVNSFHPRIGEQKHPGAPYRFSETPWKLRRPAPLLGQHQAEILGQIQLDRTTPATDSKAGSLPETERDELPLKGIRIVDFTRVWAGPFGTRYLADLGAEVIKIETGRYLDTGRTRSDAGPMSPEINRSKLGVTLDFQHSQGQELARRLVETSDVVVENFAAGVMERHGLGYESLKRIKPDIVMVSMPGYGNTGPYSSYVAYGQSLMAYTGLSVLWGYPDSPYDARPKVHYTDFISAAHASTAIMAALEHRAQTGRGQYIEIPQSETLASTMGVALLDYLVNRRAWQPIGNRSLNAAPHGCYPCRGDDQWCVISCRTDDQWDSLREALGDPPWASGPEFDSAESRIKHQDELDERIGQWTVNYTPYQVMRLLQRAGVPAGVVQSGEQLYHDHHMRSRDFVQLVEHSDDWGPLENTGITVGLSRSPGRILRGLPGLGQHNDYVFSELLGTTPQEFSQLVSEKVIA